MAHAGPAKVRDNRIDLLRGAALWMILIDHVPRNRLGWVTLHVWGFCDAADIFVLLAGVSSMLAYGRAIDRDGLSAGLGKVALRCVRIYAFQVGLLLATLGIVYLWTRAAHVESDKLGPIFQAPAEGLLYGLTLRALPSYLDILPLYLVLLAVFPLIYLVLRRSARLALAISGGIWLLANLNPELDLPNWMDGKGWYFNPFAWQFLFTIGVTLSRLLARQPGRLLPWRSWAAALAGVYLFGAFLEAAPWSDWGLPSLRLFAMAAPDKSSMAWPRILDILSLSYLLFSSTRFMRLAQRGWGDWLAACGRNSLEVFAALCLVALLSRLALRLYGDGLLMQVAINVAGIATLVVLARWLDARKPLSHPGAAARMLPS